MKKINNYKKNIFWGYQLKGINILFIMLFIPVQIFSQFFNSVTITGVISGNNTANILYSATSPTIPTLARIRGQVTSGAGTFIQTGDNMQFTSSVTGTGIPANLSVITFTFLQADGVTVIPASEFRFIASDIDGPNNEALGTNCASGVKFAGTSIGSNIAITNAAEIRGTGTQNQNFEPTSTIMLEFSKRNVITLNNYGNSGFLKVFDLNNNNYAVALPLYFTCNSTDTDGDGVTDKNDLDDDNDGILDTVESGGNSPDGDADGDGLPNYLDIINNAGASAAYSPDGSTTNYTDANNNGIPDVYDFDGDGIPNHLDLDSDNDGCPDAIEGSENVLSSQLTADRINTAANGGVGTNAGTDNGVPNLVNTGGSADNGNNSIGQAVGTSKNAAVQDLECSTAIGCSNALYLSQSDILYTVNTTTNPFTYPQVGVNQAGNYNAIGISPVNGRMYAMPGIATANNLLVINANGSSVNLGPVTNLPAAFYNAGEVDNLGNYYVKASGSNNILYRINVATLIATPITLSTNISVADLAFRTTNGLLYTVSNDTGQLLSINPTTGAVTGIGASPGAIAFGALFGSSTGEIYGSENGGGFFQFNLTNGQRVQISASPASGTNDGAHCVTTPIAFSADLAITKTDNITTYAPGSTRVYTIVARNNGPFGVLGATVSDPLPTGILAANVSYTAVAAGGATTSVSGTQTGAINDVVNLPVNATVTYTVTVNIPFTFTGDLVNTATITAPANSADSNLTNNTATDTDTQTVCYRPGITSGTVLNTNHGITSLNRAGSDASGSNWPMVRKGAWTVLESKTKGFVVNRLTTLQISQIPAANLVEGMMVYNVSLDCLQINTTGTPAGWACFGTPTCPSN